MASLIMHVCGCASVYLCVHMYACTCNYWIGDSAQSPVQTPGSAPLCSDSGPSCPQSLPLLTVMAPSYRTLREISPKKCALHWSGAGRRSRVDWEDSGWPLPIKVSLGHQNPCTIQLPRRGTDHRASSRIPLFPSVPLSGL